MKILNKPIFKKYALSCKILNISNRNLDDMSNKIINDRQAKMFIPKEYKNVITFHGINEIKVKGVRVRLLTNKRRKNYDK